MRVLGHSSVLVSVCAALALAACGDDGGKTPTGAPDTSLDTQPAAQTNQRHFSFTFSGTPATGSSSSAVLTFNCSLDGADPSLCTSPLAVDVSDGDHTFAVTAVQEGNADPTPASAAWHVDSTPPDTMITKGPPSFDNSVSATIEFTGTPTDDIAKFECAFDSDTYSECTSPHVIDNLTTGPHTAKVRAVDAIGNADPTPAQHSWNTDTSTPDTTITSGPASASVTNGSATFAFTSTLDTAVFECAFDGGSFTACVSPIAYNSLPGGAHTFSVRAKNPTTNVVDPSPAERMWMVDGTAPTVSIDMKPTDPTKNTTPMFTFSSADTDIAMYECQIDGIAPFAACTSPFTGPALAEGSQTFRVRATDNVGNQSTTTYTWTIDTTPPSITITSGPSGATSDKNPTFTFSIDGVPITVQCQMDAGAFADCVSPKMYTALSDGAHTFTIKAVDAAGNSASVNQMFTLTTVGPTVTITSGPTGTINNNKPSFTFTTVGATTTDCRFDGGTFATCTSPFTAQALAEGQHTFEVRARDAANNTNSATRTFTVDTIAPTVAITSGPAGPTNQPKPTFTFITNGTPTATECRFDTATYAACTSPFTPATSLSQGAHEFDVRVTDAGGNIGTDTRSFSVVTTGPVVTIDSGPTGATNSNAPVWTFTVANNPTLIQCKIDAGAFANCTSPFMSPTLADGTHTFIVQVSDAAGNTNSDMRTIMVDTSAPSVTITSGPSGPTNIVKPVFTFTTAGAPNSITCHIDTDAAVACTSPYTAPNALGDGPHSVTITVADAAGNVASAIRSFTVDTSAPTVTITSTVTDETNNKPSFTFTTTGSPTVIECAMDAGAFAACTSPYVSTALGGGMHTFHVRVADDAGNSNQADQTFNINSTAPGVTIAAGPTGSCPAATTCTPTNVTTPVFRFDVTAGWSSVQCHIDANALTDCHGSFPSPTAFTGGTFTAGTLGQGGHTFEVVACNASSNCSSAFKTFTVDTTPPTLNITAGPSGNCGQAASVPNGTASTTCTTLGVSPNNPSFVFAANADANTYDCGTQPGTGTGSISFSTCSSHTAQQVNGLTPDGDYTFAVKVTDLAYNVTIKSVTFNVDTAAPSIAYGTLPTAEPNGVKTLPTIPFTVSDLHVSTNSNQCSVDSAAYASCGASSYTFSGVNEGEHSLQVQSRDTAGNLGSSVVTKFIYDKTAPTIAITNLTPHGSDVTYTASSTPSLTVKVVDATGTTGALTTPITVTCGYTKTGGGTASCPSTLTTAMFLAGATFAPTGNLPDGTWTLNITASDGAGNSTTLASTPFVVDTSFPSVGALAFTPASPNKNPAPTFSLTASDNAMDTVVCSYSGPASGSANCTPGTAPAFSYTPTLTVEGDYTFSVTATDKAGNATTQTLHYYFDKTPPTISAITGPGPGTTNPTNVTPKFGFTLANTNGGPGAITTTCYFDTTANPGSCATAGPFPQTVINVAPATSLTDGTHEGMHTFVVNTTDASGNTATASQTFYVDTVKPTVAITSPTANQIVNTHTPSVTFTATDTAPGVVDTSSYVCNIDGTPVTCTSTTFSPTVSEGSHTLTITTKDTAGNLSTAASVTFISDTIGPTVTVDTAPPSSPPQKITGTTITFHANDANGVASAQCTGASCTISPTTDNSNASGSIVLTGLADGTHTYTISATDRATPTPNQSSAGQQKTVTFTTDNTPPTISSVSVTPTGGNGNVTSQTPTVTISATDVISGTTLTYQCAVDAGAYGACTNGGTVSVGSEGSHTLHVKATDEAGNQTATPTDKAFTIDSMAPTGVAVTTPATNGTTVNASQTFVFSAGTDASTISYACAFDTTSVTCAAGTPVAIPAAITDGSHTFHVVATDAAGNAAPSVDRTFTLDKTPPTVTAVTFSPLFNTFAAPNGTSATFSASGSPTSYTCSLDNSADASFTSCTSPVALATLTDSAHHFYVKATDAVGNTSAAFDGSFNADASAPTVAIKAGATNAACGATILATDTITVTISDTKSGPDDASTCTGATCAFTGGVATFSIAATTTFSVNAKDKAGNAFTSPDCTYTIAPSFVAIKTGPRGPTNDAKVAYGFELSDKAIAQKATAECSYDGGAFGKCTTDTTYVVDAPVAQKVHTFAVRAKAGDKVLGTDKASFELDPIAMCLDGKHAGTADLSTLLEKQDKSSVELWFKTRDADAKTFDLFALGTALTANIDAGNLVVHAGKSKTPFALPSTIDLSQWHHYAVSLTSTSLTVYIDGEKLVGTAPATLQTLGAMVGANDVDATLAGPGAYLDLRITTATRSAAFHPTFPAMVDKTTTALYPMGEAKGRTSLDLVDTAPDLEWAMTADAWSTCAK